MSSTPTRSYGENQVVLAHGGGGELTRRLIAEHILPKLTNGLLSPLTDSAVLPALDGRVAFTTDSFVVQPLEFPGGDIGRLAVCGTVNDLAVMGAEPKALSLAMVLEEGLAISALDRMVDSIAVAAREAAVMIATGDTKVIERRRGDGMIITTAGVGVMRAGVNLAPGRIACGDCLVLSGRVADHGLAVMSAREGLAFETALLSDAAPLTSLATAALDSGADVKFMRDPTRGGLAGVVADLADETGWSIELMESAIPISRIARHTAEMLGLDPLTVANEGKIVAVVPEAGAARVVEAWRSHPLGREAAVIGRFFDAKPALIELITRSGGRRIVQRPYGEELPRIC